MIEQTGNGQRRRDEKAVRPGGGGGGVRGSGSGCGGSEIGFAARRRGSQVDDGGFGDERDAVVNADLQPTLDDLEFDLVGGVRPVGEPIRVDAPLQMRFKGFQTGGGENLSGREWGKEIVLGRKEGRISFNS